MNPTKSIKINPLSNPFVSLASTSNCTIFPNIFQHNDRFKQNFDQQSQQSRQSHRQTFGNKNNIPQIQEVNDQSVQIQKIQKYGKLNLRQQSFSKRNNLPLSRASRIQSQNRQSIIDKIKQFNPIQSRQIDTPIKPRKKIFQKSRKIGYINQAYLPKQISSTQVQHTQQIQYKHNNYLKYKNNYHQTNKNSIINQGCKHAQYMLKSIQIINKLTQQNKNSIKKEQKYQNNNNILSIYQKIIQVKIEIQKINNLNLQQIIKQQKQTIKWIQLTTNQLRIKIFQQQINNKQILQNLQIICKHSIIINKIKEQYLQCKQKLSKLAKKIQNIFNVSIEQKYYLLKLIIQHVKIIQLYLSACNRQLSIQNRFNQYLTNQKLLLLQAYKWIQQLGEQ